MSNHKRPSAFAYPQQNVELLDRIRLGNVRLYKKQTLFTDESIIAGATALSPVLDTGSNGDYMLSIFANLVANSGAVGKADQTATIQTSIDGAVWFDKNIPVNIFVDSDNTPIVNDEYSIKNRWIRIKWVNGSATGRTLNMNAELNICGINDIGYN
tara:strand:- start:1843 stop:2310 length:468 start_codon:yes stop_codon:yes gene_type:complete